MLQREMVQDELGEALERIHVGMTDSDEEGVLRLRITLKNADEAETHKVMSELREAIRHKKFYLLPIIFPKQATLLKVLKRILLPSGKIIVPEKLDHDGSLSISVVLYHKKNELR